jgi:hypothetical protein
MAAYMAYWVPAPERVEGNKGAPEVLKCTLAGINHCWAGTSLISSLLPCHLRTFYR